MVTIPEYPASNVESWNGKLLRKLKQNPWVPLGATATVVTLVVASIKMRRGESQKMNHWLRARVAAQGITLLAICGGAYLVNKREREASAKGSGDMLQESGAENRRQEKERREFEERLKDAEEAHRIEVQGRSDTRHLVSRETTVDTPHASGGHGRAGWLGWLGWGASSRSNAPTSTSEPSKEQHS